MQAKVTASVRCQSIIASTEQTNTKESNTIPGDVASRAEMQGAIGTASGSWSRVEANVSCGPFMPKEPHVAPAKASADVPFTYTITHLQHSGSTGYLLPLLAVYASVDMENGLDASASASLGPVRVDGVAPSAQQQARNEHRYPFKFGETFDLPLHLECSASASAIPNIDRTMGSSASARFDGIHVFLEEEGGEDITSQCQIETQPRAPGNPT